MKIKYKFVTGDTIIIEVSDGSPVASFLLEEQRREASADRKYRRHNYSLDAIMFESEDYYAAKDTPESLLLEEELQKEMMSKINLLTEKQRRRLVLRLEGKTIKEIAYSEDVSVQRVRATFEQIAKFLKK